MSLHYLAALFSLLIKVSCQEICTEGDVMLAGVRNSELEGRVEVCGSDSIWGTVCDDRWGQRDASVVCRQLGFSPQGAVPFGSAYFGQGRSQQPIALDDVQCQGSENEITDCPRRRNGHNCFHSEDAGVHCEAVTIDGISTTDTSASISWNSTLAAIRYDIIITWVGTIRTTTRNGTYTYTIITDIFSNETEVEFEGLLPEQNYSICISGVYSQQQTGSFCRNVQTSPIPTPTLSLPTLTSELASSSFTLLGGVLGFIIALLVLLLIVAGVGLAYPRCIRSRVKDKKYLSNISEFLDRNMYLTSNTAYIDRSQLSSANQGGSSSAGANIYIPPSYETIQDPPSGLRAGNTSDQQYAVLDPTTRHGPPSTSQVTASIVAEHYEMFEHGPEHSTQPRDYAVSVNAGANSQQPAGNQDDYSQLQYQ